MVENPTNNTTGDIAWEEALEEAISLFEQGEAMDHARFEALVQFLRAAPSAVADLPPEDPRVAMMAELAARAARLEASAAEGTGPTDQVSSLLGALVGQPARTDAPAVVEVEGIDRDD